MVVSINASASASWRIIVEKLYENSLVHKIESMARILEKQLNNDSGILGKVLLERGILSKPTIMVMKVYVILATRGQLPGAEIAPVPAPLTPIPPKS